jgi:hypothetical protein
LKEWRFVGFVSELAGKAYLLWSSSSKLVALYRTSRVWLCIVRKPKRSDGG